MREDNVTLLIIWSLNVMGKHSTPLRLYQYNCFISISPFLESRNFNGVLSVTVVSVGAKWGFSLFLDFLDFTESWFYQGQVRMFSFCLINSWSPLIVDAI